MDLQDAVDAEGFVFEACDGVYRVARKGEGRESADHYDDDSREGPQLGLTRNLLGGGASKVVDLALIRRTGSVPDSTVSLK